jgi:short-subunit dehydrogenase
MSHRFHQRVVVISGASTGIGAAAARRFATEGARLVLAARGKEKLEEVAAELRARGTEAIAVPTDVADWAQVRALFERADGEMGGVDIVVNSAGLNLRGPIENHEAEDLAHMVAVNLSAPIVISRVALPYLERSNAAAIVHVASLAGRVPVFHEAVYSATKFGLRTFCFALADELAPAGIKVSAVSPGPVDTGFIMDDLETVPDLVLSQPLSTADEIAALILDCAADGRQERVAPQMSGYLTTLGYLFPALRRALLPVMKRQGRRAKERYLERQRRG